MINVIRKSLAAAAIAIIAIASIGCDFARALLEPERHRFALEETRGFDVEGFRDRLAALPGDAGWHDDVNRNLYVARALVESGWSHEAVRDGLTPDDLALAVGRAVYDAARRPEWSGRHRRDQAVVVAALTRDVSRLCGIDKHIWMEVVHPLLDAPRNSLEQFTAAGMARGSEMMQPDLGAGALASHVQLALFVRTPRGRRDLFEDQYRPFLDGLYSADPLGITGTLYKLYPAEGEALAERWDLLLELQHIHDRRRMRYRVIFRTEGAEAADDFLRDPPDAGAVPILEHSPGISRSGGERSGSRPASVRGGSRSDATHDRRPLARGGGDRAAARRPRVVIVGGPWAAWRVLIAAGCVGRMG